MTFCRKGVIYIYISNIYVHTFYLVCLVRYHLIMICCTSLHIYLAHMQNNAITQKKKKIRKFYYCIFFVYVAIKTTFLPAKPIDRRQFVSLLHLSKYKYFNIEIFSPVKEPKVFFFF